MNHSKYKKGHLGGAFKRALLTGMTAMTLMSGTMGVAEAAKKRAPPPPVVAYQEERQPWQTPPWEREQYLAERVYEANVRAVTTRTDAIEMRIHSQDVRQIEQYRQARRRDPRHNRGLLREIFTPNPAAASLSSGIANGSAGRAQAQATEARQLAALELQFYRQQESIDNRYRMAWEREQQRSERPSPSRPSHNRR